MPTMGHIILLADQIGTRLAALHQFHVPTQKIVHISTLLQLNALPADMLANARLIGFRTGVVVPARILRQLKYGAYNFHPGPPEYPGWAPSAFAIYDQALTFGVTAHKMINKVDAGPIIGVERFPMPPNITSTQLQLEALKAMARLLRRLAPWLVNDPKPLPVLPLTWGIPLRTRTEFNRMRELPGDLDEEEWARHRRAFLL